ncbi:MAG: AAA family ATPase, partial [Acidiferrobacterales bacterium]|nr:AAA family ATPase [Acidiferrobacterales bacterium]
MKCPQCHTENAAEAAFCDECGARLETTCPSCGSVNRLNAKFCNQCGQAIGEPGSSFSSVLAKFSSPQSYTPSHLAEKILTSRGAIEGERKLVTNLFADLKSSMEMLADRDPEEAHNLLDPVVQCLMDAVHRYEGTVSEVRGDGIMAIFGAPVAHEDHAQRACYAALDMQAAVRRYSEKVMRTHGIRAQIRVGINSGEVVVRAIGSDLRIDYSTVGKTTHLAGRMEQLADPGSILLTADTLLLAEGYIEVKSLGLVPVKGLDERVEVYELTGAGPVRSRLHAAVARGLTRFVGREAELERLRKTLEQAANGRGQVVSIVGEAGVGKSRLVWELVHSHRTKGWLVVQASSVSYGKATPYFPVIDLLKSYFHIEKTDDHRTIREKLTGKLLTLDRELESILSALLALLDVPVEDEAWNALDARRHRQQILNAVKQLVLQESLVQPLLVVFEDLHWIDSETQTLLDSLVESIPAARVMLLVNYRPEYAHRWSNRSYYTQLGLGPLAPDSAEELLTTLLGTDQSLNTIKRILIARTEGNPFFLEESVRALVETDVLTGEKGSYRTATPSESVKIPSTVQAVLAARLDRLPSAERQLLSTAAVIGKNVPFLLLQAISDQDEQSLRQALAHLQTTEFLYETALYPELEYTFKHALTQEVAYGALLSQQRRNLHARIVETIEGIYGDRLIEHIERLAHHASSAELWPKAVDYLRQAGAKSAARCSYPEAVAYIEQALVALENLPETRETRNDAVDLRFGLRTTLQALGEHERVYQHLCDAERLASALGDQRRLGWASAYLSQYLWLMGDSAQAKVAGERALNIASSIDDFALDVVSNFFLGQGNYYLANYGDSIDHCRRNV